MRYGVLGPLQVSDGERSIEIDGDQAARAARGAAPAREPRCLDATA